MQVRDDEVIEPHRIASDDQPRRVHGSFRLGGEPALPDLPRTFNLRPSIDELPEEQSLTIEINGRPVATLICSPAGTAELALGWSFAQGYFDDPAAVQRVTPYGDRISLMIDRPGAGGASWRYVVSSGFDGAAVRAPRTTAGTPPAPGADGTGNASLRFDQPRFLTVAERLFARFNGDAGSGAIHHAAVTDGDHLCAVSRDVCRHNAVDKVIGWTLSQRLDRDRLVLCLSGRVSADLAFRAARGADHVDRTRPRTATRDLRSPLAPDLRQRGFLTHRRGYPG
jgi:FdhD protein